MAVAIKDRIETKTLRSYFGVKSFGQIKRDLALSRTQSSRGEYKTAGAVLKGIRTRHGL
ncbi:hypothetical protein IKW75_01945 [Candidatus Saccharibacteria bacterium]|nr:hypothetical protein [Candidatus Saccharibacteria bacterium]